MGDSCKKNFVETAKVPRSAVLIAGMNTKHRLIAPNSPAAMQHEQKRTHNAMPTDTATNPTRPVALEVVTAMNDRVLTSDVLRKLHAWRREDKRRNTSTNTAVSDRAVLVGLLILSAEGIPMSMTRLAELFESRIDAASKELLGLPTGLPADATSPRTTARWIGNTTRAFHRLVTVMDPFAEAMNRASTPADPSGDFAANDVPHEESMKTRLDAFTQALLQMTFAEQPAQFRDSRQRINIAIADHMIPDTRRIKTMDQNPSEVTMAGATSSATAGTTDTSGDSYLPKGTARRAQPGTRQPATRKWGREASIAVRVDPDGADGYSVPRLAVSATLHLPMQNTAHTAITLMRGALDTGLIPGIIDTDLGYFASNSVDRLHVPTFEFGFTPCTDYKKHQLGVSNASAGVLWVEGNAYCPLLPARLITASTDFRERRIDTNAYNHMISERNEYMLRAVGKPNQSGAVRMVCAARTHDRPAQPRLHGASGVSHQEDANSGCSKVNVSACAADLLRRQAFTYGTPAWQQFHSRSRTAAEIFNATMHRTSTASHEHVSGFAAAQILLTMTLVSYNLREITRISRRERMPSGGAGTTTIGESTATKLTIRTDKARGTADLLFHPRTEEQRLLADLHDTIVAEVDGTRPCGGVRDALVAIRKRDYGRIVDKLAEAYLRRGFQVVVE